MQEVDVAILSTIYDNVMEIAPNIYALELNKHYGLANKTTGKVTEAKYSDGIYRDKYAILGYECGYSGTKVKSGSVVIIFSNPVKEIEIEGISSSVFEEHSGTDYKILDIADVNQSDRRIIINTITGEEICSYTKESDKISYRPYNEYIVIGIKNKATGKVYGITQDLEYGEVSELLSKKYTTLKAARNNKYHINSSELGLSSNKEITLTEYGQRY